MSKLLKTATLTGAMFLAAGTLQAQEERHVMAELPIMHESSQGVSFTFMGEGGSIRAPRQNVSTSGVKLGSPAPLPQHLHDNSYDLSDGESLHFGKPFLSTNGKERLGIHFRILPDENELSLEKNILENAITTGIHANDVAQLPNGVLDAQFVLAAYDDSMLLASSPMNITIEYASNNSDALQELIQDSLERTKPSAPAPLALDTIPFSYDVLDISPLPIERPSFSIIKSQPMPMAAPAKEVQTVSFDTSLNDSFDLFRGYVELCQGEDETDTSRPDISLKQYEVTQVFVSSPSSNSLVPTSDELVTPVERIAAQEYVPLFLEEESTIKAPLDKPLLTLEPLIKNGYMLRDEDGTIIRKDGYAKYEYATVPLSTPLDGWSLNEFAFCGQDEFVRLTSDEPIELLPEHASLWGGEIGPANELTISGIQVFLAGDEVGSGYSPFKRTEEITVKVGEKSTTFTVHTDIGDSIDPFWCSFSDKGAANSVQSSYSIQSPPSVRAPRMVKPLDENTYMIESDILITYSGEFRQELDDCLNERMFYWQPNEYKYTDLDMDLRSCYSTMDDAIIRVSKNAESAEIVFPGFTQAVSDNTLRSSQLIKCVDHYATLDLDESFGERSDRVYAACKQYL